MSTATEHAEHDRRTPSTARSTMRDDARRTSPTATTSRSPLILAVLTALETATYWVDFGPFVHCRCC